MSDPLAGRPTGHLALEPGGGRYDAGDWERAAGKVLRKTKRLTDEDPDSLVWRKLTRTTLDGVDIPPLGHAGLLDGLVTSGRPDRSGDWDNRVLVTGDAEEANEAVLTDLANGATSVWLRVAPDTDLAVALAGVALDRVPVVLDAPGWSAAAARSFLDLLGRGAGTANAGTSLGLDPYGELVRGGGAAADWSPSQAVAAAREAGVRALVVDGTAVHDLGASEAQELGYSMAVAAAYLRELTAAGLTVEDAAEQIEFRYAGTDEQFPTIAKLRAARRLWSRVLELSGAEAGGGSQRQHAVTSRPMMSKYDPYVNLLRTTVAAFAAGVGGADAVTVLPFDIPLGRPDAAGRRLARNTNSLLMAESHLSAVTDPAGGAYAVEKLTDDLAAAGWAELGRIEQSGGVVAAVADSSLLARIAEVAAKRDAEVATRRRPLTGVSEFPNLAEELPQRPPGDAIDDVRRYGAAFEVLRDQPAAAPVFLATMGSVAKHTARATFATNLFAAGGVAVEAAGATKTVEGVLAAYTGQPVVCLAGTDPTYGEWGADLAAALRAAGARRVILAGQPGPDTVEDVDDSCAMGVDALAFLARTREALA